MSPRVEKQARLPFSRQLSSPKEGPAPPADEGFARDNRAKIKIAVVRQVGPIHVQLICNHPIEREGMRLVIEGQPGMTIVGDIRNNLEELSALDPRADIILLDIDSADLCGLEHLPKIVEMAGTGRVIVLTNACKQDICRRIARLGAMGVVSKDQAVETLVKAIKKVHSGEIWFDRTVMAGLIRQLAQPTGQPCDDEAGSRISALTRREREVIGLLGQGLNAEKVAKRLFISETTVRHHLSSILEKLCVRDRFDLVFYAYRHGLALPPKRATLDDPPRNSVCCPGA